MSTLKEESEKYTPPQTLNIADIEKISVDLELKDGSGTNKEGKEFKYKYAEINGEQYRVPGTILGGIKALLEKFPNLEFVTILKQGSGLATRYQVIPYTSPGYKGPLSAPVEPEENLH